MSGCCAPMGAIAIGVGVSRRYALQSVLCAGQAADDLTSGGFDPVVLQAPASMWLMLLAAAFIAVGTVLMRGLTGFTAFAQQGWSALIGIAPLLLLSAWLEPQGWGSVANASWVAWGANAA